VGALEKFTSLLHYPTCFSLNLYTSLLLSLFYSNHVFHCFLKHFTTIAGISFLTDFGHYIFVECWRLYLGSHSFFLYFFSVLGTELRPLYFLGKPLPFEPFLFALVIFEIGCDVCQTSLDCDSAFYSSLCSLCNRCTLLCPTISWRRFSQILCLGWP
jgi:hypothetical protein